MKILLASSEVHPYAKTGGLADMVGALGKALALAGQQVGLVTPLYAGVRERHPELKRLDLPLDVALGVRRVTGEFWTLQVVPGLTIYFVDQPEFYQRAGLYQKDGLDYPDNAERFFFFAKAIAHLALHLAEAPDILHLHDWQAALATLFVHHQGRLPDWGKVPATCMTIHNLAYQGVFPASQYALTNLPWDYFTPSGVEFYGNVNCLKAGISFADVITTVSPRYAREITTPEFGCGLDGLLRHRQTALAGILNGVDYTEWNPSINHYIHRRYSATDLSGKTADKAELQRECGLAIDPGIPLFGNIGRLVDQKGVDILLGALEEMLGATMQFVLLGSGMPAFQRAYHDLGKRYPGQVSIHLKYDEGLAHRIEAGCDFFLMPSRFEPCGLNQMYSLRFGTVPIVRAVGGLDDTIIDAREDQDRANGIKFHDYLPTALAKAIRKALVLYQEPELLQRFRLNGMSCDFSWDRTAEAYIEVYERAVKTRAAA